MFIYVCTYIRMYVRMHTLGCAGMYVVSDRKIGTTLPLHNENDCKMTPTPTELPHVAENHVPDE